MNAAIRINLLDWRAEAREGTRRRFIGVLIGAALATVLIVGVLPMLYYGHRLNIQEQRNRYLQTQINEATQKLVQIQTLQKTRENLTNRMHIIGELQHSRAGAVHYFDQLVATLPDGVTLTRLDEQDKTTTLDGIAESNARVSQYMTNLDGSGWFTNPRLIVIKRDDSGARPRADFTLKVDFVQPDALTGQQPSGATS